MTPVVVPQVQCDEATGWRCDTTAPNVIVVLVYHLAGHRNGVVSPELKSDRIISYHITAFLLFFLHFLISRSLDIYILATSL